MTEDFHKRALVSVVAIRISPGVYSHTHTTVLGDFYTEGKVEKGEPL